MPPVHDAAEKISDIVTEVSQNLYDSGMKFYTQQDILDGIQDWYNKIFAILCPLEYSTLYAQVASPYYDFAATISNFMYVSAIYNPVINLWLEGMTYQQFKSEYQTYLRVGEPRFAHVASLRRTILFPFNPSANGTSFVYIIFKAIAPTINTAAGLNATPMLPFSVGAEVLEYGAMATLLEQRREFKKAMLWWAKVYTPQQNKRSLWDQMKTELQNTAKTDRDNVLEPYRWVFHGGAFSSGTQVTNETPSGTADGTNTVFQIANVPQQTTSIVLKVNGVTQVLNTDFTFNGQTIYFITVPPNLATLLVSYIY